MATEQGGISLVNVSSAGVVSADNSIVEFGGSGPSSVTYFKNRGWNTVALDYEFWNSTGAHNPVPPIGPCVGIGVAASWTL